MKSAENDRGVFVGKHGNTDKMMLGFHDYQSKNIFNESKHVIQQKKRKEVDDGSDDGSSIKYDDRLANNQTRIKNSEMNDVKRTEQHPSRSKEPDSKLKVMCKTRDETQENLNRKKNMEKSGSCGREYRKSYRTSSTDSSGSSDELSKKHENDHFERIIKVHRKDSLKSTEYLSTTRDIKIQKRKSLDKGGRRSSSHDLDDKRYSPCKRKESREGKSEESYSKQRREDYRKETYYINKYGKQRKMEF